MLVAVEGGRGLGEEEIEPSLSSPWLGDLRGRFILVSVLTIGSPDFSPPCVRLFSLPSSREAAVDFKGIDGVVDKEAEFFFVGVVEGWEVVPLASPLPPPGG